MNVGNSGTGVYNVIQDGSDDVGVCGIIASGRSGRTCCKFVLKSGVGTGLCSNSGTHLEDLKDFVEVQLPGSNRLLVVLHAETPGDNAPFIPLD